MFYIFLQSNLLKKKVGFKYKIKAKNKMHEASKTDVYQLKFDIEQKFEFTENEVNSSSISHLVMNSIHAISKQCSANNDIFNNNTIEYCNICRTTRILIH